MTQLNPSDPGRTLVHDEQSRAFAYPVTAPTPGKTVLHTINATPLDQMNVGACTGFAAAQALNTTHLWRCRLRVKRSNRYLKNEDGLNFYHNATVYDDFAGEYPPVDEGSSGLGAMKGLKALGYIDRYEWTFGFQHFLAALQNQPVCVGVWWYEKMFWPDANGLVHVQGDKAGGHEILATGILWEEQLIRFRNSWGPKWGKAGNFFIPWTEAEALMDDSGDVAVPIRPSLTKALSGCLSN